MRYCLALVLLVLSATSLLLPGCGGKGDSTSEDAEATQGPRVEAVQTLKRKVKSLARQTRAIAREGRSAAAAGDKAREKELIEELHQVNAEYRQVIAETLKLTKER